MPTVAQRICDIDMHIYAAPALVYRESALNEIKLVFVILAWRYVHNVSNVAMTIVQ
jgi:hypothetical protein